LLFLAHRLPFPPNKGDKIRSWHFLQHMASRYRVHLGCLFDDPSDARHTKALSELCASVCFRPLRPITASLRSFSCLLSDAPMTVGYFGDKRLRRWVKDTIEVRRPSRIFVY